MDAHLVRRARNGLEPELLEIRELLVVWWKRIGDVYRGGAGREAVLEKLADRAEIGCAEEGGPVVLAPIDRPGAALLEAEAREARAFGHVVRRAVDGHLEVGLLVEDLASLPAVDDVDRDATLEERPEMEERGRERGGPFAHKASSVRKRIFPSCS